jgi:hypothetical protein
MVERRREHSLDLGHQTRLGLGREPKLTGTLAAFRAGRVWR